MLVRWSPATDNSGRIASYWVTRRPGSIVTVPGNQTSFVDQTVAGRRVFTYSVRAVDPSGNVGPTSGAKAIVVPASTDSSVSIPKNRLVIPVTAGGVVPVTVACSGFFLHCGGTLTLMLGKRKVGSRRFGIASGKVRVVKVVLSNSAFTTLLRKRKLRVTALLVTKNGVGDPPIRKRKRMTLKAPKGVGATRRPQAVNPAAG